VTSQPEERHSLAGHLHDRVGAMLFAIGAGIRTLRAEHAQDAELNARLEALEWQTAAATAMFRTSLRTSQARGLTSGYPGKLSDTNGFGLTRREYDILLHVSLGETNAEIAKALGLKSNTVKTYVQNALSKLGARNRIEAVNRLHELGLL
jgi:DNA-binding NarL/FixJ family response regulator